MQRMLTRRGPGGQPPGAAGHAHATPDFTQLARAAGILQTYPALDRRHARRITLLEMRSKARRLKIDNDLRLIVVDYLQLMRSPEYSENRVQEISDISRSLKALARELDIPVIALSQLSRASEQRGGERKPILSDLRDSGAIEQDADLVIFIHRPEMYYDREDESKRGRRRGHAGQESQRPDRRRAARLRTRVHPLRQPDRPRGAGIAMPPSRGRSIAAPSAATSIAKWVGRCEGCGAWNAVAEEPVARHGGTAAAAEGRQRAAPAAVPPSRLRDVATNPLERWRTGLNEFDFVLGGGIVPGLDDSHRRRAGNREVHAAAAGGGAAGDRRPHRALRQRRGVARPDPAPGRPPGRRRRARCTCSARPGSRPSSSAAGAISADVVVIDSIQTVYTDTLESAPGNVGQVRECSGQLMRFAKESGTAVDRGGPRHQGRRHRRAQDARAHRGYGALLRGRGHARLPAASHHQEPVRLGGRARRVLDDRSGPGRRAQSVGRLPRGARRRASAAARSPR